MSRRLEGLSNERMKIHYSTQPGPKGTILWKAWPAANGALESANVPPKNVPNRVAASEACIRKVLASTGHAFEKAQCSAAKPSAEWTIANAYRNKELTLQFTCPTNYEDLRQVEAITECYGHKEKNNFNFVADVRSSSYTFKKEEWLLRDLCLHLMYLWHMNTDTMTYTLLNSNNEEIQPFDVWGDDFEDALDELLDADVNNIPTAAISVERDHNKNAELAYDL